MDKKYHLTDHPILTGHRIYEDRLEVMGVVQRKSAALAFCRAKKHSIDLELDPSNSNDPYAIRVIGSWPSLFRRRREHIGFVPRDVSKRLADAKIAHAINGRLLKTYASADGFVEILFQITGPTTEYLRYATLSASPLEAARAKATAGNVDDAEIDYLALIDVGEQESRSVGMGVAPAPYLALAKLYRKAKRRDDEVAILERYERQTKAPGVVPGQLAERLQKLRR